MGKILRLSMVRFAHGSKHGTVMARELEGTFRTSKTRAL